ncbi:MAG: spore coat associated protein CotJA [Clostridiales bacterium]|nr:spore coat associated protein CotJA [Clostridiales bacterium]
MYSHLAHLEPAMAYVPCQTFGDTFPLDRALSAGTIFPVLCKPFCGKRGMCR